MKGVEGLWLCRVGSERCADPDDDDAFERVGQGLGRGFLILRYDTITDGFDQVYGI